jgi:hypothetical protein
MIVCNCDKWKIVRVFKDDHRNEKDEMISFLSRKHHRVKEQTILRHFFAWVTGLKAMDLA